MVNLRGNVNTRLRKVEENDWQGAIFAAAGLERIDLRPPTSIDLDWMLPAPAQGAIMVVCREDDGLSFQQCQTMNHEDTALCTSIERAFLRSLLGGCSTPISALAEIEQDELYFRGNLLSPDGKQMASIEKILPKSKAHNLGSEAAAEILEQGGQEIITIIRNEAQ
jgi:hydroxymethylbilane synthase